ncbi:MAG: hypothetical protein ACI856_000665 [Kiritimatiellia bacterium]|jgi:hypothetical protein
MKPPICKLCRSRFDASDGGLVKFANDEPLPAKVGCGPPKGLRWFGERHYAAAEKLKTRRSAEALKRLRLKYWLTWWLPRRSHFRSR